MYVVYYIYGSNTLKPLSPLLNPFYPYSRICASTEFNSMYTISSFRSCFQGERDPLTHSRAERKISNDSFVRIHEITVLYSSPSFSARRSAKCDINCRHSLSIPPLDLNGTKMENKTEKQRVWFTGRSVPTGSSLFW